MITNEKLDKEWIQLISKAKQMGLSPDEVRSFLQQFSLENNGSIHTEH